MLIKSCVSSTTLLTLACTGCSLLLVLLLWYTVILIIIIMTVQQKLVTGEASLFIGYHQTDKTSHMKIRAAQEINTLIIIAVHFLSFSGARGGGGPVGHRRTECGEEGPRGVRGQRHHFQECSEPGNKGKEPRERQGDGRQRWAVRARTNLTDWNWNTVSFASISVEKFPSNNRTLTQPWTALWVYNRDFQFVFLIHTLILFVLLPFHVKLASCVYTVFILYMMKVSEEKHSASSLMSVCADQCHSLDKWRE